MKLGYINYLNCFPLYYYMTEKSPIPGVEIVPGYPDELNEMMRKGELDMSPISSAAYADIQDDAVILPDFCLASVGYVRSVILIGKLPIEDLNHKIVGLSRASQTSAVLLKCLMKNYYRIEPSYRTVPPEACLEGLDAALIIGNEAMTDLSPDAAPYIYDLGDLWFRKTGHPVVFAVFAARKSFMEAQPGLMNAVRDSYRQSLQCLDTERDIFIGKAGEKYPNISYDIAAYFRLIKYGFTPELKAALRFYFSLASGSGFLKAVNSEI